MDWSDPCNCLDPFRPVARCHTAQTEALRLTELDGDDRRLEPPALNLQSRISARRTVLNAINLAAFE